MRVIAGAHKGRRLLTGRGDALRPTSGRVKEALFSILGNRVAGARMLDLFAGTGAIGIEALSRGAGDGARIERQSALTYLRRGAELPYDLVFADPPYKVESGRDLLPDLDRS